MASSEEVKSLERVVEKLDDSIEKLTDISNNIGKLLAVHDQRLDTIEKDTVRNEDDIRDLHYKIEGLVKDLSIKIDESMKASNGCDLKKNPFPSLLTAISIGLNN